MVKQVSNFAHPFYDDTLALKRGQLSMVKGFPQTRKLTPPPEPCSVQRYSSRLHKVDRSTSQCTVVYKIQLIPQLHTWKFSFIFCLPLLTVVLQGRDRDSLGGNRRRNQVCAHTVVDRVGIIQQQEDEGMQPEMTLVLKSNGGRSSS